MAKNYVGKGWGKKFDNGGMVVSISIKAADVFSLPQDEHGNIHLSVGQRKEPDEKSKADWNVTEDEYWTKKIRGEA